MSEPERWIVIPNWAELQHYKERDPAWVKLYTRLLHKDEYAELTYRQRGILHSLWMLYAASDGLVNGSHPARLGRLLGSVPVRTRDIEALNHAGYITLSASKPLALRYHRASPEREREVEREEPSSLERGSSLPRPTQAQDAANPRPNSKGERMTIDINEAARRLINGAGWDEATSEDAITDDLHRLTHSTKTTGTLNLDTALEHWREKRTKRYPELATAKENAA